MLRALASTALRHGPVSTNVSVMSKTRLAGLRAFSESGAPLSGTVKWFDAKKGFGFLIPDDGSEDIFVHHSAIHAEGFRSLMDGEPVEYDLVEDDTGRKSASNVTGPDGAYVQGRPRQTYRDFGGGNQGGGFGGGGADDDFFGSSKY